MAREVQSVFPDVDMTDMLVVPTCQQADYDLVRTGDKIESEKDRLLERVRSSRGCSTRHVSRQQMSVCLHWR